MCTLTCLRELLARGPICMKWLRIQRVAIFILCPLHTRFLERSALLVCPLLLAHYFCACLRRLHSTAASPSMSLQHTFAFLSLLMAFGDLGEGVVPCYRVDGSLLAGVVVAVATMLRLVRTAVQECKLMPHCKAVDGYKRRCPAATASAAATKADSI